MTDWWISLGFAQQFFFVVAVFSTLVFLVQLVLTLMGIGDQDVGGVDVPDGFDLDHPGMEAHSTGAGMLSVRTVLAFLVGFGWAGVLAFAYDFHIILVLAIASFVGLIFMSVVFLLMRAIYSLSDVGTVDLRNARGQAGTVYTPIPASKTGKGQIQVTVQGRLREVPSITDEAESLPTGTPVRVVRVLDGGIVLVRKLEVENE